MAKHPVVVYGASGYTGMLIMDWLIDQHIPFTAVARNAKRAQEMMAQRVVRLESATYEIVEAEHTVEALAKVFKGAKVVCNTVGPFVQLRPDRRRGGAEGGLPPHRHDRRAELHPRRARPVRRGLPPGRPAGVAVDRLHVHVRRDRRRAGARDAGRRLLETATLCRGTRFAAAGVTVGLHRVDLRAVRASSSTTCGRSSWSTHPVTASFNVVGPGLHAAGVRAAVGRHLAAGVLRARPARAQLHLVRSASTTTT